MKSTFGPSKGSRKLIKSECVNYSMPHLDEIFPNTKSRQGTINEGFLTTYRWRYNRIEKEDDRLVDK